MARPRKLSFGKRMFVIFSSLSCFVIIVTTVFYYLYAYKEYNEQAQYDFSETVNKTVLQLDELISTMDVVSSQVLANKSIQQIFTNIQQTEESGIKGDYFERHIADRSQAQGILWSYNSPRGIVENINIFTSEGTFISLMRSPSPAHVTNIAQLSKWKVADEKFKLLPPHEDDWGILINDQTVISLVRPLTLTYYNFEDVATIEVQQAYAKIERIASLGNNEAGKRLLIIDGQDQLIYPHPMHSPATDHDLAKEVMTSLIANHDKTDSLHELQEVTTSGETIVATYGELHNTNWTVLVMQPKSKFLAMFYSGLTTIIILGISFIVFILIIVLLITHNLMKPLVKLRRAVNQITLENNFKMIDSPDIDEIELLQSAFYESVQQIQQSANLFIKAKESQLRLKISELQAKVNPHFLYNSLMAISAAGQEVNNEKVQAMCLQLSELFRYSSSDDEDEVTLAEELEHITTYLDFMRLRYEENLITQVEQTGDLQQVFIPRLVLQPIIENSFTHGFLQVRPPFLISIRCEANEKGWQFEVKDNGQGIDKETIDVLVQKMSEIDVILRNKDGYDQLKTDDLALINLYIRLKIQYQDRIKMIVGNAQDTNGAFIRITVSRYKSFIEE